MKSRPFSFEFVELVPAQREDGMLYISIKYRTAVHNCLCGCGQKVVTPIRPTGWRLTYDGDAVSLHPSIGNWSFPCRSHYWLRRNLVVPAGPMNEGKIAEGRRHDQAVKERYLGNGEGRKTVEVPIAPPPSKPTFWQRLRAYWS